MCCVLPGRGVCVGLITRLECGVSDWVWSWILDKEEALDNYGCCALVKKKTFVASIYSHRLSEYYRIFQIFRTIIRANVNLDAGSALQSASTSRRLNAAPLPTNTADKYICHFTNFMVYKTVTKLSPSSRNFIAVGVRVISA